MNHIKSAWCALLLALPSVVVAQQKQQEFTINGIISKVKLPATAFVLYLQSGQMKADTGTIAANGTFTIKGKVPFPLKGYVMIRPNTGKPTSGLSTDQAGIYLEGGNISFSTPDSMFRAKVGGTPLNDDQQELTDLLVPFDKQEKALDVASKKEMNAKGKAKIKQQYQKLFLSKAIAQEGFIKRHSNSLVSLNLLRSAFNPQQNPEKSAELYDALNADIKASSMGQAYLLSIGKAKALTIGNSPPDFIMKNTRDEEISLSSFKGKYVLVDFWASWCAPCRVENPNLVKAYEKYKDRGFEILGVSLDGGENAKEKWMDAIKKDGLAWEQVSDLRGWGSAVVQLYQISAVPTNYLLDPNGKIIGKDLRGEDLEAKLATLF